MGEGRSPAFYWLAAFFAALRAVSLRPDDRHLHSVVPGSDRRLDLPFERRCPLHWFERLWHGGGIVDISGAFERSLKLGLVVMILTVLLSLSAGLAFRKRFAGSDLLFFVAVASLIVPSIVTSLRDCARIPPARRLSQEPRAGMAGRRLEDDDGDFHLGAWRASHLDLAVRPPRHVRDLQSLRQLATKRRRATSARRRGRRCATSSCRSSCLRSSASGFSASRSHGMRSRARARPWASTIRCRWNCRR